MIEHIIGYHCGPALAGIKPSNIVSLKKYQIADIHTKLDKLNEELNGKDIYFETLCECERCILVMVYRKKQIMQYLERTEIAAFLEKMGYPRGGDIKGKLEYLKARIDYKNFPHEIGAFLGYPIHDIYGFMNNKKSGCIMTGEWRVYKNPEEAQKLFERYKSCRKAILKRINGGKTLAEMFAA